MKFFNLTRMALFVIIMCVNLISCNNDDESVDTKLRLSTKLAGEWVSYQARTQDRTGEYWKDCGPKAKVKIELNGDYTEEIFDLETGKRTSYHSGSKLTFSEDQTELWYGNYSDEFYEVLISTQALDNRPYDRNLFIFSGDFKRMKLGGYKFKKL